MYSWSLPLNEVVELLNIWTELNSWTYELSCIEPWTIELCPPLVWGLGKISELWTELNDCGPPTSGALENLWISELSLLITYGWGFRGIFPQELQKIPLINPCWARLWQWFCPSQPLINHNGFVPSPQFNVLQELLVKSPWLEIEENSLENLGAVAECPTPCRPLASPLLCGWEGGWGGGVQLLSGWHTLAWLMTSQVLTIMF